MSDRNAHEKEQNIFFDGWVLIFALKYYYFYKWGTNISMFTEIKKNWLRCFKQSDTLLNFLHFFLNKNILIYQGCIFLSK